MSRYGTQPVKRLVEEKAWRFPRGIARAMGLPPSFVRRCMEGHELPDVETYLALPEFVGAKAEECWTAEVIAACRR